MFFQQLRVGSFLPLVGFLAATASANTYVVGAGPGADFPDLPSAIASAHAGDVLLVQAGSYSGGFTLDKGLTILGSGSVLLTGSANVTAIPEGQRAVVVQLTVAGFLVDQCDGPVVLQQITSNAPGTVAASADVRCLSISVSPPSLPTAAAVSISNSRVEIVSSNLAGSTNPPWGGSAAGGCGLVCGPGSRVHVAATDVRGGNGQYNNTPDVFAGNGAWGVSTDPASELILSGSGPSFASAGEGGLNWFYVYCCWDGQGAEAVMNLGAVWCSGVTLQPSWDHFTQPIDHEFKCCKQAWPDFEHGPGAWTDVTPNDPTLSIYGTPTNGATVTLTIRGPVGARAWLELGRRLAVVPDPDTRIEQLVEPISTLDLGTIPSSGEASLAFGVPGFAETRRYLPLPPGAFFVAQGLVTLSTGGMRRTNSIPIVGR